VKIVDDMVSNRDRVLALQAAELDLFAFIEKDSKVRD